MVLSVLKINRHSSSTLWIGLNDIGTEASYKWSDGSPVAYTNYNYKEPNDWIGVEDCLEMYRWNGKWNDLHCSMLRPYICKKTNSKCASFIIIIIITIIIIIIVIIIIIIISSSSSSIVSSITVFAGVLFVHQLGANHAPGASVTQFNHSVYTLSTFLRIRVDPSMQIF